MLTANATGYVGSRIKRREDPRLVTGNGNFTDDLTPAGTLYLHMLRSSHAHAKIVSINTAAAKAMPGVMAVFTGEDFKKELAGPIPGVPFGSVQAVPAYYPIATDRVRFVGNIVAAVVAETRGAARDAAEAIEVEYEDLPVVIDMEKAVKDGATLLHDEIANNICTEIELGNDVADTFKTADVVVEHRFFNQRLVPNALENRVALAEFHPGDESITLTVTSQNPHILRTLLSGEIGIAEHKVRVVAPDVGGGFGSKIATYAEEVIACIASRKTKKPVKWTETRSESFVGTIHGRDNIDYIRMAATKDGKITGLDIVAYCNMGGYMSLLGPSVPVLCGVIASGPYAIPNVHFKAICVYTNTTPTDAYRGAGRPEATYMLERTMNMLADKLGMDPMELRRKNFIQPDQFPYFNVLALNYDSGNYEPAMDKALQIFGYDEFRKTQEEARKNGKYIGIGQSTYVEVCGLGPGSGMTISRGYDCAVVRAELTGKVTVFTGVAPHGQGQETTFAQIVADEFNIPIEDVTIKHGDTEMTPYGMGTYGSRGTAVGGGALMLAVNSVKDKAKKIAAFQMEANEEDIVFEGGKFTVKGAAGGKSITFQEVCLKAYIDPKMAPVIEPGLEATRYFEPGNFVFPFGTHLAAVEVEPETGDVKILKYVCVDDCGKQLNPMIVEGQIHGGLTQGIAQALFEEAVYDDNGQLISGTLMDYALPTAADLPHYTLEHTVTPTTVNPLGVKGIGEAGTIASTPVIVNAVVDALKPLGVTDIQMPLRPEKLWKLIHNGGSGNGSAGADTSVVEQHFGEDNK
ncbi:MAG: xanthine dehydrogenase family protein molybdopterin-binding subunit [Chloroflexi bacterium]|nr:xanthine dehydrogenase family protein molybdopterin-binding subunit [Chloroflexota bacterium]OJV94561.1 MAG: carbon monoxide dehydrogenase [Chloroflexi bacterium 54-19]